MASIEWRGWSQGSGGLPMKGGQVNRSEPGKAASNARAILADYRRDQVHAWNSAARVAIKMGDLDVAREFLEKAESFRP